MKVKTNLRAGRQNRSGGSDDNPKPESPADYTPPVSRCAGI